MKISKGTSWPISVEKVIVISRCPPTKSGTRQDASASRRLAGLQASERWKSLAP